MASALTPVRTGAPVFHLARVGTTATQDPVHLACSTCLPDHRRKRDRHPLDAGRAPRPRPGRRLHRASGARGAALAPIGVPGPTVRARGDCWWPPAVSPWSRPAARTPPESSDLSDLGTARPVGWARLSSAPQEVTRWPERGDRAGAGLPQGPRGLGQAVGASHRGSRPGSRPVARPRTRPEVRPTARPLTRPVARPVARPATRAQTPPRSPTRRRSPTPPRSRTPPSHRIRPSRRTPASRRTPPSRRSRRNLRSRPTSPRTIPAASPRTSRPEPGGKPTDKPTGKPGGKPTGPKPAQSGS